MRVGIMGAAGNREVLLLEEALREEGAEVHRFPASGLVSRIGGHGGTPRSGPAEAGAPHVVEAATGVALHALDGLVVRSLPGGSLEQVIYRVNVLHRLEEMGVVVVNPPVALERTVDKFYTTALLAGHGLPVPATVVVERYEQAMAAFREMGRAVLKPLFGSRGVGMVLLEDPDVAHRVFRALEQGRYVYYLQEFLPHGHEDMRLFVLGGQVLAAMRRCGETWKTNISSGAVPEAAEPDPWLADLAVRTARVLGADYVGVDVLVSGGQPYVIEANGIPGWAALQSVARVDIARSLARYVLGRIRGSTVPA